MNLNKKDEKTETAGKDLTGEYVINQTNAKDFVRFQSKARKLLTQNNLWHKIIIHNVMNSNREAVLKTLLNAVHPCDLIPVNYKLEGQNAHFIARNCGPAIEKLCRDNLIVTTVAGQVYILTIILGSSDTSKTQLNVQSNIFNTIQKRYSSNTKILNLDAFHRDSDLSELIFCVLSQPKILYFVLHLAKPVMPQSLKLSNNEIRVLSPLEALWGYKNLTSLDLRNNSIPNMVALSPLKNMKITELWLDGNPVCNHYDEINYIQAIKEVCPTIEKLDGMIVGTKGFLAYRRNFAVSTDCQQLVDQFLSHFFTLYDSGDRKNLDGLYKKDALFSISCSFVHDQSTSLSVRLENYKRFARNLIKMSDFSKSCQDLIIGDRNIIERLCKMPHTEHDPYTFTVDVLHYSLQSIAFVVTGAFREPTKNMNEVEGVYGFTRTFVLQGIENGEFVIINEMLHITNATTSLANRAFKIVKVGGQKNLKAGVYAKEPGEKLDLVNAFCKLTTLNKSWARKCLEDSKWDFKKGLEIFVELYKSEKIPISAFQSTNESP